LELTPGSFELDRTPILDTGGDRIFEKDGDDDDEEEEHEALLSRLARLRSRVPVPPAAASPLDISKSTRVKIYTREAKYQERTKAHKVENIRNARNTSTFI